MSEFEFEYYSYPKSTHLHSNTTAKPLMALPAAPANRSCYLNYVTRYEEPANKSKER